MIEEFTNISVTGHLVVFATFLESGVLIFFLDLLNNNDGKISFWGNIIKY